MREAGTVVAGVPALMRYRDSAQAAMERGTVLFYHGFGGTKERCDSYLTALAEAGLLAVGLDAVGHGERRYPDFDVIFNDERWDAEYEATETGFLQLIDDTAAEVPAVIDDLIGRGLARPDRVGVGGRSLGGNVAYAAVLADPRVRAAASVVGSPEWTLPRAHSPHHHPDRFFPAAILSQAAELDEYVPAGPIRDFHTTLSPWYGQEPGRICYIEYPGVGHFLTPELNAESVRRVTAWFQRWLPA
jgi:dienelactone hydrolase